MGAPANTVLRRRLAPCSLPVRLEERTKRYITQTLLCCILGAEESPALSPRVGMRYLSYTRLNEITTTDTAAEALRSGQISPLSPTRNHRRTKTAAGLGRMPSAKLEDEATLTLSLTVAGPLQGRNLLLNMGLNSMCRWRRSALLMLH